MELLEIFIGISLAYLIGSIPISILISKLHFGIDIREHGQGEASHLNVRKVLGWKVSWLVRILDVVKGWLALSIYFFLQNQLRMYDLASMEIMQMSFGLAVILGHIFPVWARFKGGKGIHVAIGVMLFLAPQASLFCILIAIATWFFTQNQNFGYIMGSAALPVFMIMVGRNFTEYYVSMLVFSCLIFIFLLATHYKSVFPSNHVRKIYHN